MARGPSVTRMPMWCTLSICIRRASVRGDRSARQLPVRPRKVARVPVGIPLEVILMLGLRFPEVAGAADGRHHLAGPDSRGVHVRDGVLRDGLLLVAGVE